VLNSDISIKYISTHDQLADVFTKGLSSARFSFLRDKLMVCSIPISLWGAVNNTNVISTCLDTSECEDSSLVQNTSQLPTTSTNSNTRLLANR
jgi:hypothetical protein